MGVLGCLEKDEPEEIHLRAASATSMSVGLKVKSNVGRLCKSYNIEIAGVQAATHHPLYLRRDLEGNNWVIEDRDTGDVYQQAADVPECVQQEEENEVPDGTGNIDQQEAVENDSDHQDVIFVKSVTTGTAETANQDVAGSLDTEKTKDTRPRNELCLVIDSDDEPDLDLDLDGIMMVSPDNNTSIKKTLIRLSRQQEELKKLMELHLIQHQEQQEQQKQQQLLQQQQQQQLPQQQQQTSSQPSAQSPEQRQLQLLGQQTPEQALDQTRNRLMETKLYLRNDDGTFIPTFTETKLFMSLPDWNSSPQRYQVTPEATISPYTPTDDQLMLQVSNTHSFFYYLNLHLILINVEHRKK